MATHGGRGERGRRIGRWRLSRVPLRLSKQSALSAMRARHLGTLVIRGVFQMLIAVFAGAFEHARCCHLREIETCSQTLKQD